MRAVPAKVRRGGGAVPPTDLLRRTRIQANSSKLTRESKLSQAKSEHYEHSTCARGTVADQPYLSILHYYDIVLIG